MATSQWLATWSCDMGWSCHSSYSVVMNECVCRLKNVTLVESALDYTSSKTVAGAVGEVLCATG